MASRRSFVGWRLAVRAALFAWAVGGAFGVDAAMADAPAKGGTIRLNGFQPPKSMNAYVDNFQYTQMTFQLMYETLIETDSETSEFTPGLASSWKVSDDAQSFTFTLDPAAKWSDGRPVTADDVKWTFDAVMAPDAQTGPYKAQLCDFESPLVVDERTVVFRVHHGQRHWRDLLHCGQFPIMPRHAFEGRDFNALSLEGAVVSGPYRLARLDEQVESVFERRGDWWRNAARERDRGRYNFDRIVMRYFADDMNAYEAFKLGKLDVYAVYTARIMATETRGEKYDRNHIRVRRVANQRPCGFQGFAMNMRRPPFDDLRVRKAMAQLIDRETMNRTLMYSQYFLHRSYLESLYDARHPCGNVFWKYDPAAAAKLLDEAGWTLDPGTGRRTKEGRSFAFTFLSRSASEDKFLAPFAAALKDVGIEMSIVRKDLTGWARDMDEFNFDMTWSAWGSSVFPNAEPLWSSREADRKSGCNYTGFASKEVDALIEEEKSEFDVERRAEINRRIDALIAEQVPYVLLWNINSTRLLYWNKFGMPEAPLGRFGTETEIPYYWWYDADAAEELRTGDWLPSIPVEARYGK